jgi:hypothetical protein
MRMLVYVAANPFLFDFIFSYALAVLGKEMKYGAQMRASVCRSRWYSETFVYAASP